MTLSELVYAVLDVRDAKKDGEVWVQCPFCNDEKYRLGINLNTGLAHCFRGSCDWKTRDKVFLFKSLCTQFNYEATLDYEAVEAPKKKRSRAVEGITLPNEFEALWTGVDDEIGHKAKHYLTSRGVTEEQIRKHRLGFCASGENTWRIIIPVYYGKRLLSYTGRDFSGKSELKYKNSEGIKFYYNVPKAKNGTCILSEGAFDAWAIERATVKCDSIARLGTGFTPPQRRVLECYDEIILWPDPDKAGVELCISMAVVLDKRAKLVSLVLLEEDDVDPGKLGETPEGTASISERLRSRVKWNSSVSMKLRASVAFT